jgi:lipopolysaccharide transport system ATP-binding protein
MAPAIRAVDLRKYYDRRGGASAESLRDLVNSGFARLAGRPAPQPPDEVRALDGLSFEIAPGEAVGVVGPNGAGKTTLLKVLSRITRPTAGFVELRGRVGAILDIGMGFHRELTGRENIELGASMLGMSPADTRRQMDSIVAFAGVDGFLETPLRAFSSGMFLRLAFAVATHVECEIVLVDEVLLVGDAVFQRRCVERLKTLAREGRTVVMITHHLELIADLCGRVMQLARGRLVRSGGAAEIIRAYLAETVPEERTGGAEGSGNGISAGS